MGDSAYSYSLTTFSTSGKLLQIEHALRAVQERGRLAVGICAKDGVVIATCEKMNPLIVRESFKKVCPVTKSIGMTYSGMSPDYRVLLGKSRKEAQLYFQKFRDNISTVGLTRKTAEVMQEFTQQGGVRPFGVSLLIAGWDDTGPKLYQADASGSFFQWKATAIGRKYKEAKEFLEKRLFTTEQDFEVDVAIEVAVNCVRQQHEEEVRAQDLEVGVVTSTGFRLLDDGELATILDTLN